jgi:phosphoribosyl-dephospho-CoA transferase
MDALASTAADSDRMLRPHDLLWIVDEAAISAAEPLPGWASADWLQRAPLVVRRETTDAGRIPVGLRGITRSERVHAYVPRAAVRRIVCPEDLVHADCWHRQAALGASRDIAAYVALRVVAPLIDALGVDWGPTGSIGFALASGLPLVRPDSDLDLVVRAPGPLTAQQCNALAGLAARVSCRLDIQVDTGLGAFALQEWIPGRRRVLFKTDVGPRLTEDPWSVDHLSAEMAGRLP